MAANYPLSLDDNTTLPTDKAGSDSRVDFLAGWINNTSGAIRALEAVVGIPGSLVETSHDYLIKLGEDPGHTHTGYSLSDHEHEAGDHDHDSDYATVLHSHDATYSALAHDHDASYSATGHNHTLMGSATSRLSTAALGAGVQGTSIRYGSPVSDVIGIQGEHQGTAYRDILLQYSGGNLSIGGSVAPYSSRKLTVTGASAAASSSGNGILAATTGTGAQTDEAVLIGAVDGSYGWVQAMKQATGYRDLMLQPAGARVIIGATAFSVGTGYDCVLGVAGTKSTSTVLGDFQLTTTGAAGTDSGALRGVAWQVTGETQTRGVEAQVIRESTASATYTWGIEVGVHTAVAGDGVAEMVGIYVGSNTGWISGTVRADSGIFITGDAGWARAVTYRDTDLSTDLWYVTQAGAAYHKGYLATDVAMRLKDGVTAPSTVVGYASIYVDTADGDLKVKFADGTVKTIATDT